MSKGLSVALLVFLLSFAIIYLLACDNAPKYTLSSSSSMNSQTSEDLSNSVYSDVDSSIESIAESNSEDNQTYYIVGNRKYYLEKTDDVFLNQLHYIDLDTNKDITLDVIAAEIAIINNRLFVSQVIRTNDSWSYTSVCILQSQDKLLEIAKTQWFSFEYSIYPSENAVFFTQIGSSSIFKLPNNSDTVEEIKIDVPDESSVLQRASLFTSEKLSKHADISSVDDTTIHFSVVYSCTKADHYLAYLDLQISDNSLKCVSDNPAGDVKELNGWYYFLDPDTYTSTEDTDYYDLYKMRTDGTGRKKLNIRAFNFTITDNYIFADEDCTWGDFLHWSTYRYSFEGTGRKIMETGNMKIISSGDIIYFSTFFEDNIYVADKDCNQKGIITVEIPDKKEIQDKLGDQWQISGCEVEEVSGDWITFYYNYSDYAQSLYYGEYKINIKTKECIKISGKYNTHLVGY